MANVLYLTYDGLTDPLGQSQVLPYLEGLTAEGHRFTVVSCEKPGAFAERESRVRDRCEGAAIGWQPLRYTKSPPILSTMWDVRALRRKSAALMAERRIDLVHCRSYIAALVGHGLFKRFGVPFVFDMRGFWADERIDGELWRLSNPIHKQVYRYFKRKEQEFLRDSAAVVSLTEAGRDEMLRWQPGALEEKIHVIPCCTDFEHFDYRPHLEDRERLRRELNLRPGSLVVSYHGSVGTWYLLDEMLAFFSQIVRRYADAQLLLLINDDHAAVRQRLADAGIEEGCAVVTRATREDLPSVLSVADLALFFIKPTYSKMSSSPTKLGETLALGKPVICNAGVGDLDRVFADGALGLTVDAKDPSTWGGAIDEVDRLLAADSQVIRRRGLELFDLSAGVEAYARLYETVIPNG